MVSKTLDTPYYAVIFTSRRSDVEEGYQKAAQRMLELAAQQEGFLHVDSVRQHGHGITVSYWRDLESINRWKQQAEHLQAQQQGKDEWYTSYQVRICKVERDYDFDMQRDIPTL